MARSFFAGTDAELYTGSAVFSAKINESPESFGLSESACAEYAVLNAAYAAAYLVAWSPSTRTSSAVIEKSDAAARLRVAASNLAKIVSGAGVSDAQKVSLGLNVRAAATPLGAPGTPTGFRVELRGDGSLGLTWKCDNPRRGAGTLYLIARRIGGDGAFVDIGRTGKRRFVDDTLPRGCSQITYKVQAVRSTAEGQSATFNVSIGVVSRVARAGHATPAKLAA